MSQTHSYGVVGPFDSTAEDWSSYAERFRLYFTVNDLKDDEKQRAICLTTCEPATYGLFRSLAAPKKPSEVTLKELWELVAAHFHPQPSLAVQRFRFNSRTRQVGESVAAYLAELKKLSDTVTTATRSTICYETESCAASKTREHNADYLQKRTSHSKRLLRWLKQ